MPAFMKRQNLIRKNHRIISSKPNRLALLPAWTIKPLTIHEDAMGNQALQRMILSGTSQANLEVDERGDKHEREADLVGDQATSMPGPVDTFPVGPIPDQIVPVFQRRVEQGQANLENAARAQLKRKTPEKQGKTTQILPASRKDSKFSQRFETQIRSLRGKGQPLPVSVRGFFEPRFGYHFSQVRVHEDAQAATMARLMGAQAFAMHNDIVLAEEHEELGKTAGKKLLAHELTHVVQQNSGLESDSLSLIQCKPDQKKWVESTSGRLRYAREVFEENPQVRPLNDTNFWRIFTDRNKVVVVDFWAKWCLGPCGDSAEKIASLAKRYGSGPYSNLVKFYHVELGEKVNPRLTVSFPFTHLPTVFFYYTSTGKPPSTSRGAPLLEGSLQGIHPESEYIWRIGAIMRRHGHSLSFSHSGQKSQSELESQKEHFMLRRKALYDQGLCSDKDALREPLDTVNGRRTSVIGKVNCLLPDERHEIRVELYDEGCTRPATKEHEMTHVNDIKDCCRRWRTWARHQPNPIIELYKEFLHKWVDPNNDYFESRAYWNDLKELDKLYDNHGCKSLTESNIKCCKRILNFKEEVIKKQRLHHIASKPLVPCPWPPIKWYGEPIIKYFP